MLWFPRSVRARSCGRDAVVAVYRPIALSSRSCIHTLFTFSRAMLAVWLVGKPTRACSLTDPTIPSSPRVACHVLGPHLGLFMEKVG